MLIEELYNLFLQYPSVQTDSRKWKTGDLYFALKGENFNDNQFAIHELEKVEVDAETFKILDGKLYLFYNTWPNNTLKSWNKNEVTLKKQGDANWAKLFRWIINFKLIFYTHLTNHNQWKNHIISSRGQHK